MFGRRIAVCLVITLAFLVAGPSFAALVDLDKIDRALKREPAYSEKPRYCLLVFGADAATKVWLVLDGEDLYADLNADGNLGERFSPKNRRNLGAGGYRDWEYQLGEVAPADGAAKHTRFEVTAYQQGNEPLCHVIRVWVNDKIQQYAGWAQIFEDRREDAPVIHFGAPVICRPLRSHSLSRTATAPEIHLCFGTPGRGNETISAHIPISRFVGHDRRVWPVLQRSCTLILGHGSLWPRPVSPAIPAVWPGRRIRASMRGVTEIIRRVPGQERVISRRLPTSRRRDRRQWSVIRDIRSPMLRFGLIEPRRVNSLSLHRGEDRGSAADLAFATVGILLSNCRQR